MTAAAADAERADPASAESADLATRAGTIDVQYLGHATVLLDLSGVRIITDPFLRDRLGPLRRHGPTPQPDAIGPIDVVLVSHAHPDHFDRRSLRALAGDPLVIVPRGLGALVQRAGLRAREVVVGEPVGIAPGWSILPVAARHWRWPAVPQAAAIGYVIERPGRSGIYFAGDTARYPGMREFADRVDVALLPVGSWGPHLSPGHLGPRSAAEVARLLEARHAIPIHWGTLYPRGLDAVAAGRLREPATRFASWARRIAPDLDVRVLQPGESTRIND
jgi:L-ascorbate metabolism protein UlaG (beta-lactamase superfamily)